MNYTPAPIIPVELSAYRQQVHRYLLLQVLGTGLLLGNYWWFHQRNSVFGQYAVLGAIALLSIYLVNSMNLIGRLATVFPDEPGLSQIACRLLSYLAVSALPLHLFLYLKRSPIKGRAPVIFRSGWVPFVFFFFSLSVPGIFLDAPSPMLRGISYWTSPSLYEITQVAQDAKRLIALGHQDGGDVRVIKRMLEETPMSSTGVILSTAVFAKSVAAVKDRGIASEKKSRVESIFIFLEGLLSIQDAALQMRPAIFKFNPLVILSPASVVEVVFLAGIDAKIRSEYTSMLLAKLRDMLPEDRDPLKGLSETEARPYRERLLVIRQKLGQLK